MIWKKVIEIQQKLKYLLIHVFIFVVKTQFKINYLMEYNTKYSLIFHNNNIRLYTYMTEITLYFVLSRIKCCKTFLVVHFFLSAVWIRNPCPRSSAANGRYWRYCNCWVRYNIFLLVLVVAMLYDNNVCTYTYIIIWYLRRRRRVRSPPTIGPENLYKNR